MAEKLGQRLREVKTDFEDSIKAVEKNNEASLYYSIHVANVLDALALQKENHNVMMAALKAQVTIHEKQSEKTFFGKTKYISHDLLIQIIKLVLKTIDEELPKEEKIDTLEDTIADMKISLSEGNNPELQEALHKKARSIARLLVEE